MATKMPTLKKPTLTPEAAIRFAEGAQRNESASVEGQAQSRAESASEGRKSGLVPEGDVRLTANIRADLHMKLKMRAVQERTTVGELIEGWIASWS